MGERLLGSVETLGQLVATFSLLGCLCLLAAPPPMNSPEFAKLLTLAGDWRGESNSGMKIRVTFRAISGGTTLLETIVPDRVPEMLSVYHPSGEHVMMTHYCCTNSQPRMCTRQTTPGLKELNFKFLDGTNMANATDVPMHELTVRFRDPDHFQQEWRSAVPGDKPMLIEYTRLKPAGR
ncbi:MAG: hypothetical protein HY303_11335 [Candidatus Wallbacteria bacterium]|nr:hypothetical protein [Candidatus Wallbacteria bacterium]